MGQLSFRQQIRIAALDAAVRVYAIHANELDDQPSIKGAVSKCVDDVTDIADRFGEWIGWGNPEEETPEEATTNES